MKENVILVVASLSALVLASFHMADDIVYGYEKGQLTNLTVVPIMVLWLYGTLILAERRSGYIIVLLTSFLGMFVPYVHMSGRGIGLESRVAHTDGHFFFVWTLIALGGTALFSFILSVRGLWKLWRGRSH